MSNDETARDKAVRVWADHLRRVSDLGWPVPDCQAMAETVVDAIIEAARAPESAHTRTVAERQRKRTPELEQIGKNTDVDPRD